MSVSQFNEKIVKNYILISNLTMHYLVINNKDIYKIVLNYVNNYLLFLNKIEKKLFSKINKTLDLNKIRFISSSLNEQLDVNYKNFNIFQELIINTNYLSMLNFLWLTNKDLLKELDENLLIQLDEFFILKEYFNKIKLSKKWSLNICEFEHLADMINYHFNKTICEIEKNQIEYHKQLFEDNLNKIYLQIKKIILD